MAFFLLVHFCFGQNLIPNPGFENFESCPTGLRQLNLASNWMGANAGTPELFHQCGFVANILPQTGEGYAGLILLSEYSRSVEYLQVELTDELQVGEEYQFSCYIRLSSNSMLAINKIGVLFSEEGLRSNLWEQFNNRPQIVFNEVVENVMTWEKLEASYTAKGGEKFITLGNFYPKHFLEERIVNKQATDRTVYYYVDDFELVAKRNFRLSEKESDLLQDKERAWTHVVYFEKDSSSVSAEEMKKLDAFLSQLPQPLFRPLKVEGHADQDASFEYNLQLSQKRAEAVKERMSTFKLNNVYTSWSGEDNTLYKGDQEPKMLINRRVTITVDH